MTKNWARHRCSLCRLTADHFETYCDCNRLCIPFKTSEIGSLELIDGELIRNNDQIERKLCRRQVMQTFDECFVSARICVSVMRRSVFLTVAQSFG
jgi:hypothetical protein